MPTQTQVEKAISTLQGVKKIARNEMLIHGDYLTDVASQELAAQGAVCGGRQACLVGSLYLAHGPSEFSAGLLQGVSPVERPEYMRNRPALRLAYRALNDAAFDTLRRQFKGTIEDWHLSMEEHIEFLKESPIFSDREVKEAIAQVKKGPEEGWAEYYFETVLGNGTYGSAHNETRQKIIKLCDKTIRKLKKDYINV